jgi:lipopolysaccharide transport system permease protein
MAAVPRTDWRAVWDLTVMLTWRDLVARFKRSVFGVFYAFLEPLLSVAIFAVVFGVFLDAGAGTTSYPLYLMFGTLAWTYFVTTTDYSAQVLLDHAPLIRKVRFRWEVLLVSLAVTRLVTLLLTLAVTCVVALVVVPGSPARLLYVLAGLALLVPMAVGCGLFIAPAQVVLRDVRFIWGFALRLLFYVSPILYPLSRVPDDLRALYELNPLVTVLWLFQVVGDPSLPPPSALAVAWTAAVSLGALLGGYAFFRRSASVVADLL